MARVAQEQKIVYGRLQCTICRVWKPLNLFKLVEPQHRAAYYFSECLECLATDADDRVKDAEVQGWPCQYCPKCKTCQSECFVFRGYVDGDILHPSTVKKLIGAMM